MELLERLRQFFQINKKGDEPEIVPVTSVATEDDRRAIDFTMPVTEEEKELVAVIASAIQAGSQSDVHLQIKKITRIDTDKERAAAIVAAIAASDRPNTVFKLTSIEKIND